jgi:hypothetical protein
MKRNEHAAKWNKKGISFHEFAEVYRVVPRRSMYTVEEKKATWSEVSKSIYCIKELFVVDVFLF